MKRVPAAVALLAAIALPASIATAAPPTNKQTTTQQATTPQTTSPIPALTRAAHPLVSTEPSDNAWDLRPLMQMVGTAKVVGVGEATHNSHEFFTLKHRIFQTLVERKGFTAFVLEASWSTGLELDRYVVSGVGDPREIMRREFQDAYKFWNAQEYLDLIEWMRDYNRTHTRKLRFVGDDVGYASPALIERVVNADPTLAPQLTRLYAGIRSDSEYKDWSTAYFAKPLSERQAIEASAREALALVQRTNDRWAVQHARAIWQTAKLYSFDVENPNELPKAMVFRDQAMADNTAWWTRATGDKAVLSAHNGHIGYDSSMPSHYPKIQGAFLRDQLGKDYVNVGFTFDSGSFNANDTEDPQGRLRTFTIPSAPSGNNEYTLDRVPYRDYLVDLRTLPKATKDWLNVARPTRDIGTAYPWPDLPVNLGKSYDVLIHLNRVTAAHLLL
ncbi:erythromycin esterase family protein [Kribbella sp. NPDC023972]|uniref:erythromycin esterase family protein n=1 Tax=Kribbella sp. NPDC023972 TaxID=3154795 RepID=UPI0033F55138